MQPRASWEPFDRIQFPKRPARNGQDKGQQAPTQANLHRQPYIFAEKADIESDELESR